MARIAAYCRVSTEKEDQLNSLETQKEFFAEYVQRTGDKLVRVYADEGISGTKLKRRKEFLRMMDDAEMGLFDKIIVKDISRFARNTVDTLQSIRRLKILGIPTQFITANMDNMGDSEFVLTIFAALAQEESANISKRIKFGKKLNAEKGRVPNMVYGYDKVQGNYFTLSINVRESEVVRRIFKLYTEECYGAAKISILLNREGIKTKRGCKWCANSVVRILQNPLYAGTVINGRFEITDFLTGTRVEKDESDWVIVEKPELAIIDKEVFTRTQQVMAERGEIYKLTEKRTSNRHLFSTLIKCKDCGWSFRQITRTYKNTYTRWVCSGRNGRGADSCPNKTILDEEELKEHIIAYFEKVLQSKDKVIEYLVDKFKKTYKERDENVQLEQSIQTEIERIEAHREKYMNMYTDDLITREQLNEKIGGTKERLQELQKELKNAKLHITKYDQLDSILNKTFCDIESLLSFKEMTNGQLRKIIDGIEVDHEGNVDIHLKLYDRIGLRESVPIVDEAT